MVCESSLEWCVYVVRVDCAKQASTCDGGTRCFIRALHELTHMAHLVGGSGTSFFIPKRGEARTV